MARPDQVTVAISTSSQVSPQNPLPNPVFPLIELNGATIPPPSFQPNSSPSGIQVVVMNAGGDLSDPANIISNKYNLVWPDVNIGWFDTYRYMFDNVANQVMGAGDPQQQLVFVASYGMDLGMFPTPDAVELLLGLGAGPQLQQWINSDSPSEGGDWVSYPVDYVMVGSSGLGYAQATEEFDYADGNAVKTSISVTLQNNPEPPTA
jgi:hypothetical protein